MKHLKKRMRKKTVEAYACPSCGTPDDCIVACAGDVFALNTGARDAAQTSANKR